ncbi:MAG: AGE family epimerase/isomerase [Bacteroidota bacterium]
MRKSLAVFIIVLLSIKVIGQPGTQKERLEIAAAMEFSMNAELLDKYYPASYDSLYGGFLTAFTHDFKLTGPQDKFIVTQARHVWTTSLASIIYPGKSYFLASAANGFNFLKEKMWDKQYGGFYNLTDRTGKVKTSGNIVVKEAYGNAFAIYGLTAYFNASKDTAALDLAKQTFLWLEAHSHDKTNKGYFQHLQNDGTPVNRPAGLPVNNATGYKDQNSSIHLLEAFTSLYEVWPDNLLRERLYEMLVLIRDTMVNNKGYLQLFFTPDWKPISICDSSEGFVRKYKSIDHVSFGHDVETAFLMLEASHALHLKNDSTTLIIAKRMVDHALANGWDNDLGGFYNEGYYFKNKPGITIVFDSKNWWAQAEGLNSLLMMADLFPSDSMQYYDHFKKLWQYTQSYLIDHVNGDWYEEGLDKEPQRKTGLKAHIWKSTYHNFRSLNNCIKRLRANE